MLFAYPITDAMHLCIYTAIHGFYLPCSAKWWLLHPVKAFIREFVGGQQRLTPCVDLDGHMNSPSVASTHTDNAGSTDWVLSSTARWFEQHKDSNLKSIDWRLELAGW